MLLAKVLEGNIFGLGQLEWQREACARRDFWSGHGSRKLQHLGSTRQVLCPIGNL